MEPHVIFPLCFLAFVFVAMMIVDRQVQKHLKAKRERDAKIRRSMLATQRATGQSLP